MADVRALLKAKRQEIKITHPFASYASSGQLRCSACGTPVKHASAWEGHIGSKAHRTNVARIKEEERRQQEEVEREAHAAAEAAKQIPVQSTNGKRKTTEDDINEDNSDTEDSPNDTKRRRVGPAPGGFPADFFSDPSRAPILTDFNSDDEDKDLPPDAQNPKFNGPPPSNEPRTVIDLEYERFQREMAMLDSGPTADQSDKRETYERATVFAEPELVAIEETPGEFSARDQQMDVEAEKEKQSEEERERRRKEQEERELIMDRLMDEERAQEEADQRVLSIRAKFEALRKKREAKKIQESAS
ncbi:Zinc finger protein 830 [Termitomyces sp. J132]|nr:hypothetical protein H2248_003095 [Termitomyces sp. 'cryptogamus']KNZ76277.1 Zinc finger protein 830 [Termitomyces sp. J132]